MTTDIARAIAEAEELPSPTDAILFILSTHVRVMGWQRTIYDLYHVAYADDEIEIGKALGELHDKLFDDGAVNER